MSSVCLLALAVGASSAASLARPNGGDGGGDDDVARDDDGGDDDHSAGDGPLGGIAAFGNGIGAPPARLRVAERHRRGRYLSLGRGGVCAARGGWGGLKGGVALAHPQPEPPPVCRD